jgi:hypothetical protein
MSSKPRWLPASAAVALVAAVVLVLGDRTGESNGDRADARAGGSGRVEVRGCRDRVEGGRLTPDRAEDTIIGPMAFIGLPATYRSYARRPDSELMPVPGTGMPSMKAIGVLRAGARVTLTVPRGQRRWMKVIYDFPHHRGRHAIALRACRRFESAEARRRECGWRPDVACRWRYTQFSGGFGLDFAKAPRRGRCAKLIVRVAGDDRPLVRRLFRPKPGACRRR